MVNKTQDELILNDDINTDLADDIIVINNEDGTKIVIIKENGNWMVLG